MPHMGMTTPAHGEVMQAPSPQLLSRVGSAVGNAAVSFLGWALTAMSGGTGAAATAAGPMNLLGVALSGPRGVPTPQQTGAAEDDAQDELRKLRAEVSRLREESRRGPGDVREVIDVGELDARVAQALKTALSKDSRGAKRPRDEEETASVDKDPSPTPAPKARPRRARPSEEGEGVDQASLTMPATVTRTLHRAFLAWTGTKGTLKKETKLKDWVSQVGKRHNITRWHELLVERGLARPPHTREALMGAALRHFMTDNPEWNAGGKL